MKNTIKEKFLSVSLFDRFFMCVAFVCLLTLTIRPMIQITGIVLFLFLVTYYLYLKKNKLEIFCLAKDEKMLFIAFLCMTFSALPPLLVNNSMIGRELNLPTQYLLFSLSILLFFKVKPHIAKELLFALIGIAGILVGILALSHLYIFTDMLYGGQRFRGFSGINETGVICGSLCVFNIIIALIYDKYKPLFFIASMMALIAVVGTGLRSSMLAVGFAITMIFVINLFIKAFDIKYITKLFFAFLVIGCIIVAIVIKTIPGDRVGYTQTEIEAISQGDYSTSIGLRFVMYKEALAIFTLSPIIGMSAKSIYDRAEEIATLSNTHRIVDEKSRETRGFLDGKKHNDILNVMAKRGIIGLASLLFFYFAVFYIFLRHIKTNSANLLGAGMMLLYIGVGFSGDPLMSYPESALFGLMTMFILSLNYKHANIASKA